MVMRTDDGLYEFRFFCPRARRVYLTGDFNGWSPNRMSMRRQPDGEWVARIRLPEGSYQFRYLPEGERGIEDDSIGVENTVLGCHSVLVTGSRECAAFPVD